LDLMERMDDEYYMRMALELAANAQGQTGANPVVGCVIVKEGRIVGLGSHLERGGPHAEIHALQMAGPAAEGSTVYVTLEPCSHHGRTPPCSDRLIREKVKRVVVGATDPNPLVSGRGIARLRENGIEVKAGVLADRAQVLNEAFTKYITRKLPFVTLKTASTLDGRIASRTGDSKWISGGESRAYVHLLRHRHQAIMVGVGTVIADDPQLTARLPVPALQPVRIVVDSQLRIPDDARILRDGTAPTLIVATERADAERMERLRRPGVEILVCGEGPEVDLRLAMKRLAEREIASVLLEGGGRLNGSMLEQGLIDKVVLFYAPKIVGGADAPPVFTFPGFDRMDQAIRLDRVKVESIGEDICISGYPRYTGREWSDVHGND